MLAELARILPCRQNRHMLSGGVSILSSGRHRGRARASTRCTPVCAGKDVDYADRAVASLPYLVPLFDGLKYGESIASLHVCGTKDGGMCGCILHEQMACLASLLVCACPQHCSPTHREDVQTA